MRSDDVTATLEQAFKASGCDRAQVVHRSRLLSDNGPSYIAGDLADWLTDRGMGHIRGVPFHSQTQGKIERWHQTLKNRILLENYYLPGDLEAQIAAFVAHYNHLRCHEAIANLTSGRHLLRARTDHLAGKKKDQTRDHPEPTLDTPRQGRLTSINRCARSSLPS
jgi:transposase InsO family protein